MELVHFFLYPPLTPCLLRSNILSTLFWRTLSFFLDVRDRVCVCVPLLYENILFFLTHFSCLDFLLPFHYFPAAVLSLPLMCLIPFIADRRCTEVSFRRPAVSPRPYLSNIFNVTAYQDRKLSTVFSCWALFGTMPERMFHFPVPVLFPLQ
jgi:hypothetical protein